MNHRARRYLHMLGTVAALLALVVLGFAGLWFAAQKVMPPAWFFAAVVALIAYVVHAHRRTNALVKEEANLSREEADRVFEQLRPEAFTTGISLRWRARTYVISIVVLAGTGAGAALGWAERSWLMLGLCGFMFLWVAKSLLARLAEPDVLVIGPTGIEDKVRYGLIPWQDIENAHLHEYEIKGTKAASLSIGVRDPQVYSQRLGPLARFSQRAETLGISKDLRFQLQALDMAPLAVFRAIRAFHERVVPAGAIDGTDNCYRVDAEAARLKEVLAELEKTVAESPRASGGLTPRQRELLARMDATIKADGERLSKNLARARRTNRAAMLALVVAAVVALLAGAGIFTR
jgi:hypothetical protein